MFIGFCIQLPSWFFTWMSNGRLKVDCPKWNSLFFSNQVFPKTFFTLVDCNFILSIAYLKSLQLFLFPLFSTHLTFKSSENSSKIYLESGHCLNTSLLLLWSLPYHPLAGLVQQAASSPDFNPWSSTFCSSHDNWDPWVMPHVINYIM